MSLDDPIRRTITRDTDRRPYSGRRYSMTREIELRKQQDNRCAVCGSREQLMGWYGDERTAQALLCSHCHHKSRLTPEALEAQAEVLQQEAKRLQAVAEWHRTRPQAP